MHFSYDGWSVSSNEASVRLLTNTCLSKNIISNFLIFLKTSPIKLVLLPSLPLCLYG